MKQKILIIVGVVALVLIAVLAFSGSKVKAPESQTQTGAAPEATPSPTAPTGSAQKSGVAPSTGSGTSKAISINITSPAIGEKWVTGKVHTIKWSAAAGISGGLELLDAATGKSAGWILSQTAPNQTSYEWDTKQVSITRNSALGKEVTSGNYIIRLNLDAKSFAPAKSAPFSIAYPDQVQATVFNIAIQNYAFSPKSLTVKQGAKVVFTNLDSVTHNVVFQSMSPVSLVPGASYTLETSALSPAPYNYYCSIHPSMTGTLVVQ